MPNNQLDTNQYLSECDPKDVISFQNEKWISISKLNYFVYRALINSGITYMASYIKGDSDFKNANNISSWFKQGENCEILRAGSNGWQKGKFKVNVILEFIPDEPEAIKSPLDDVRQEIDRSDR